MQTLIQRMRDILSGKRKQDLCDWWLELIDKDSDKFLVSQGFQIDAVPEHYLDQPPNDLSAVARSLSLLQTLMKESDEFDTFVEEMTKRVYERMDVLISESEYLLSRKWEKHIEETIEKPGGEGKREWERVRADLEYLLAMKRMDEEIDESRKRSEGKETKKLEMSHVVPVAGLILARCLFVLERVFS